MTDEREPWEDEMVEGYRDGLDRNAPEPSKNRSYSYHHGFANGRADITLTGRAVASDLRIMAEQAIDRDMGR